MHKSTEVCFTYNCIPLICITVDWVTSLSLFIFLHWRRKWQPNPVLLPGKSHGQRSLVGCSQWGRWESDTTEWLDFHFSLSCIGEGMATHSSVLAWRIPGTGEPGGLPSLGSHRVGHDWSALAAAAAGLDSLTIELKQSLCLDIMRQKILAYVKTDVLVRALAPCSAL